MTSLFFIGDTMRTATEIRQSVTKEIAESLKRGIAPWRQIWQSGNPHQANFLSKRSYHGINSIILMITARQNGLDSRFWGSADSWEKVMGAKVIDGNKPTLITYFSLVPTKDKFGNIIKTKTGKPKMSPLMRAFEVFNACQVAPLSPSKLMEIYKTKRKLLNFAKTLLGKRVLERIRNYSFENLASELSVKLMEKLHKVRNDSPLISFVPKLKMASELIKNINADIIHGTFDPAYYPKEDVIRMPHQALFTSEEEYYQTLFHELMHWSESEIRNGKPDTPYAFNELVAEIGSCFMMLELNIPMSEKMMESTQSYVSDWISHMDRDPKFIFDAASKASKNVDFLLNMVKQKQAA